MTTQPTRTQIKRLALGCAAALLTTIGATCLLPAATAAADPGCADIDMVIARGTNEPGYLGSEVGDPLYASVRDMAGSVSAYRVNYPADFTFNLGAGSADIVDHITRQAAACPGQRYAIVGYSQGAAVVHTALGSPLTSFMPGATRLPGNLSNRIAAVELFGDLGNNIGVNVPAEYAGRTRSFCRPGDPICWRGGQSWPAHIAYGDDVGAAAAWIASQIR